jgi:hypothetical protein
LSSFNSLLVEHICKHVLQIPCGLRQIYIELSSALFQTLYEIWNHITLFRSHIKVFCHTKIQDKRGKIFKTGKNSI